MRKAAMVDAMAAKGDMSKVQAEAALTAFTDVVMSSVTGKRLGFGLGVAGKPRHQNRAHFTFVAACRTRGHPKIVVPGGVGAFFQILSPG